MSAMTANISTEEFDLLRKYIEEHCGISLGDEKAYLIETRLMKLMVENGCEDFSQFYQLVKNNPRTDLRDKIIDAMTTNETLWFRDTHPFTILREKLLPELTDSLRQGKLPKVRIWSAASSTGQEPYSIAMTVLEYCRLTPGVRPEQFEIIGTDISPSALFIANAGRYDQIAMKRGMSEEIRNRYFQQAGPVCTLNDDVKKMVSFKRFNLQNSPSALGRFNIIFLRYVAIYFSEDLKRKIFYNLARALHPQGYLFVGAVESLRGFSEEFDIQSHGGGSYYKCRL